MTRRTLSVALPQLELFLTDPFTLPTPPTKPYKPFPKRYCPSCHAQIPHAVRWTPGDLCGDCRGPRRVLEDTLAAARVCGGLKGRVANKRCCREGECRVIPY